MTGYDSDDSIVFVGYGKLNTPRNKSSTSSSSKKRSIQTGSDKENQTQHRNSKTATPSKPSSSSSSSASTSTSVHTQASKKARLDPEPELTPEPEPEPIYNEKTQRWILSENLKDMKEDPTLKGATAMHGLQLSTVVPIRPDERFWEAGVKVSDE